jgi:hypothetical protein
MPIVSEHEIVEKKTKPDESKPSFSGKEKMKFSIDSILNETPDIVRVLSVRRFQS